MLVSENDLVFNLCCLQKRSARKRFRRTILDSWPECAYCGRAKPSTLDHVVPQSKGGKTVKNNLVGCCGECNLLKSDISWFVWFRGQDFWTPEREAAILSWVNQQDVVETLPVFTKWMEIDTLLLPSAA